MGALGCDRGWGAGRGRSSRVRPRLWAPITGAYMSVYDQGMTSAAHTPLRPAAASNQTLPW